MKTTKHKFATMLSSVRDNIETRPLEVFRSTLVAMEDCFRENSSKDLEAKVDILERANNEMIELDKYLLLMAHEINQLHEGLAYHLGDLKRRKAKRKVKV